MYLAIEGCIGVGKTTLARLLQPQYNAGIMLEVFEENPFLTQFYQDRERFAFQTQIFFLLSRYRQQQSQVPCLLQENWGNLISDYTFEKDGIFASINLQGEELIMYQKVHEALAEKVTPPDLLVYLRARLDTILQRIMLRDRSYERQIDSNYLEKVLAAYDDFLAAPEKLSFPTLVIDTDDLDYLHSPVDLTYINEQIQNALAANQKLRQPEKDIF